MAHKAEHAADLETGAIVGVTVQGADEGDTTTIQETLPEAAQQLEAVAAVTDEAVAVIEEVVADKGYHSRTTVHDLETLEIRTYISEPDRGPQSWIDLEAERDAVYANRRRIRGDRGRRLLRTRGELLERPCAHLYETGGFRRVHVRGHQNVLKRLLVHAARLQSGALDANAFRDRYAPRSPGRFGRARWRAQYAVEARVQDNHADRESDRSSNTIGAD